MDGIVRDPMDEQLTPVPRARTFLVIRSYPDGPPVVTPVIGLEAACAHVSVLLRLDGATVVDFPYHLTLGNGQLSVIETTDWRVFPR